MQQDDCKSKSYVATLTRLQCQYCRTISCYICQKAIPEGYAHFDQCRLPICARLTLQCPVPALHAKLISAVSGITTSRTWMLSG